jgi:membrane protein
MNLKTFGQLLKDTASAWLEDKAPRLGAALAYYTVFSLAPLLIIIIGIAGLLFGQEAAESQIITQIRSVVGEQGGQAIQTMLESADEPGTGLLGSILGIGMLLFGAAGLFGQLQDALNTIWGVQPKPGRGIWGFVHDRFLSLTMVLGLAFLLLVSLVISATLAAVVQLLGEWMAGLIGHIVNEVVSLAVITLLFAMIFKFLPDAKIAWRDVWLGAALTAFLFEAGKFLIGLYLGHSGVASAYGAAGSLAVLLVWLYYSGQIFLFGAEFTKVYAKEYGSGFVPASNAVAVTQEARAEQGIPRTTTPAPTPRQEEKLSSHPADR